MCHSTYHVRDVVVFHGEVVASLVVVVDEFVRFLEVFFAGTFLCLVMVLGRMRLENNNKFKK